MGMSAGGNQPDINVTPLIDVLLVLLIIFMVVAPLKPAQFETKVPQKNQNANAEPNPDLLMVVIKDNNVIEFPRDVKVTPDQLSEALTKALADRPEADRSVILAGPTKLEYSNIVNVIDIIKGAGATTIGLQVDALDQVTKSS
jgi:biopolymer transport protein ExbD